MKSNGKIIGITLLVLILFAIGIGVGNILESSDKGEAIGAKSPNKTSEPNSQAGDPESEKEIGLEQLKSQEGIVVNEMKIGYKDKLYPEEIVQIEDGSGEVYIGAQDLAKVIGAELQWNGISKQLIIKNEQDYIVVDTEGNTLITSEGKEEQVNIYGKGKKAILPSGKVMSCFGYQVSKLEELGIFRIKNPDTELLDIEYSKKYEAEFNKQIEDYEFKARHERALFEEKYPQKKKTIVMKDLPNEKIAYLTFDDGPNEFTPQILDTLNNYNAKATFFVLGNSIYGKEDILKRTYEEGHSIGLHSMNHVYREVYASPASFLSQMNQCNELVKSVIGVKTRLVRPPYGSKPHLTEEFRSAAIENGYRIWDWNIDSGDTVGNRGHVGVYNYTINQASRFEGPVIILFHDKVNTAQALSSIMEYLSGRGYRFEAITEELMSYNFWGDKRYVN